MTHPFLFPVDLKTDLPCLGYKRAGMRHWYYTVPIPLRAYVAKAPRQGNLFFYNPRKQNKEAKCYFLTFTANACAFIPSDSAS